LAGADSFGVENGMGIRAVEWMNSYSVEKKKALKQNLKVTGSHQKNFGDFEIISWSGEWSDARKIIVKASTKLSMKVLESGYHQKRYSLVFSFWLREGIC
jgi:hypothetical protein